MKTLIPLLLLAALSASACNRPKADSDGAESAAVSEQIAPLVPGVTGETASANAEPTTEAAPGADAGAAPAPSGGPPREPTPPSAASDSAGHILERAAERYAAIRSLQADFTMSYENPLLRSRTSGTGVLYQKRPDRLLLRFREPAGDVILSDGRYFWVYYPSTDAGQVLRSEASAGSSSGVDLQAQFLGDPTRRFAYQLDGEEPVSARVAWQLTLKPRERLGYRQLRVWIDQRDFLARRFEITEDNGSVRRFELRGLRVDADLSDDLFEFDVPAGVRVITR